MNGVSTSVSRRVQLVLSVGAHAGQTYAHLWVIVCLCPCARRHPFMFIDKKNSILEAVYCSSMPTQHDIQRHGNIVLEYGKDSWLTE